MTNKINPRRAKYAIEWVSEWVSGIFQTLEKVSWMRLRQISDLLYRYYALCYTWCILTSWFCYYSVVARLLWSSVKAFRSPTILSFLSLLSFSFSFDLLRLSFTFSYGLCTIYKYVVSSVPIGLHRSSRGKLRKFAVMHNTANLLSFITFFSLFVSLENRE